MNFISRDDRQFKANLHAHTVLSDGNLTPEESVKVYKEKGYQILALTDHEAPYAHQGFTTDDFLMLTGYEAYIRPSAACELDRFGPEIHLNLFAKDPDNLTFIGYDPNFCKYCTREYADSLPKSRDLGPRRFDPAYIQSFIDCAVENGYLVSYNHPVWSMDSAENILNLNGCFSLEVFNTGSMMISGHEENLALYDALLRRGKFWYLHGADDNHNTVPLGDPLSDSFGSWTMVIAPELTYPSVIHALEQGHFYATTGPVIQELRVCEGKVFLECSPVVRITMHMSPKYCRNVWNSDGSEFSSAEFDLPEDAPYVYFTIWDKHGKKAHTRAFTREEFSR